MPAGVVTDIAEPGPILALIIIGVVVFCGIVGLREGLRYRRQEMGGARAKELARARREFSKYWRKHPK